MSQGASLPLIDQIRIKATETPVSLVLEVDGKAQTELQRLRAALNADGSDAFSSDDVLYEVFQWMTCNYEYEFVKAEETGDLTSAPLLGIRDGRGNVVQRWGFMDYQLRSPQDDLADGGRCVFVGSDIADEDAVMPRDGAIHKNDIKGHHTAKRALEIAATGDHSVLLYGPHGAGKATLITAFPEATRALQRDSCICGNYLDPTKICSCHPRVLVRWTRRVSRVADDCDMVIEVAPVPVKEWQVRPDPRYADCYARRVAAAREFGKAHLSIDLTDDSAQRIFEMAMRRLGLSFGTGQRILRVARTIANLDASPVLKGKHIAEAVQYKAVRGLTYE